MICDVTIHRLVDQFHYKTIHAVKNGMIVVKRGLGMVLLANQQVPVALKGDFVVMADAKGYNFLVIE
jgi:hypothetical protein